MDAEIDGGYAADTCSTTTVADPELEQELKRKQRTTSPVDLCFLCSLVFIFLFLPLRIEHFDPRIANLYVIAAAAEFLKADVACARAVLQRRRVRTVVPLGQPLGTPSFGKSGTNSPRSSAHQLAQ